MTTPSDEFELRRRLRQLPREREPQSDLWIGIHARLGAAPPQTRAPRRSWIGMALAAALVLGLAIGVLWRPAFRGADAPALASDASGASAQGAHRRQGLQREADAITLEYRLAIDALAGVPLPPEVQAATFELDASATQLRQALSEQPEATYLLERLRRTYTQRLKLTQRTVVG